MQQLSFDFSKDVNALSQYEQRDRLRSLFKPKVNLALRKIEGIVDQGGDIVQVTSTEVKLEHKNYFVKVSDYGKVEWSYKV